MSEDEHNRSLLSLSIVLTPVDAAPFAQRKSTSGRTMSGPATGDMSQKYSLSQSDDDDDNTRADGEDEGVPLLAPSSCCSIDNSLKWQPTHQR